jgi:WD40 repeat protein
MGTSAFISYARGDDEPFVTQLCRDLVNSGIDVWWDRKAMKNRGRTFLQEIRDAIEAVDWVIAVVGPKAVKSDYVRYEWEHAFLFGKGFIPLLRLGDFDLIPPDLHPEADQGLASGAPRKLHAADFRQPRPYLDALNELVKLICEPIAELSSYNGTPSLPPHFVLRRGDVMALQNAVLADVNRPVVIAPKNQTVALQGMAGIGKSVVAAAFARANSTRRAFSDGIIWLTSGKEATNLTVFNNIRAIGAHFLDDTRHYVDVESARTRLPTLLAAKVCLIVLDDVWSNGQVEPFRNALGPRCRLLVTTRDGTLVTSLGAQECPIDLLSNKQALILLAEWSGEAAGGLPNEASLVAQKCGNLPFALALCGAMVRDGTPWSDVSQALDDADLSFIERSLPNYPYPNVLRSLNASVEAFRQESPEVVERYQHLAVFPRNAVIPEKVILALWSHKDRVPERRARMLLSRLGRKALLRLEGNAPDRTVTLHDLQFDYVRSQMTNALADLHLMLVNSYREACEGVWAKGPNDGYFFERLPWHLKGANLADEFRALMLDLDWMKMKLISTGLQGLLSDFELLSRDTIFDSVRDALRLSAHVLSKRPEEIYEQLCARLPECIYAELASSSQLRRKYSLRGRTKALAQIGGALKRTIRLSEGRISCFVTLDGARLVAGGEGLGITLLDLETGEILRRFPTSGTVNVLAASSDASRLAASIENSIEIRSVGSGECCQILVGHSRAIKSLAFTSDGQHLLSVSYDNTVRIWNIESGIEEGILYQLSSERTLEQSVETVCILRNNDVAVTTESNCDRGHGLVRVWDLGECTEMCSLPCVQNPSVVALSHNEELIACGTRTIGLAISLVDIQKLEISKTISRDRVWIESPHSLLFIKNDRKLLGLTPLNNLVLLDVETGALEWKIDAQSSETIGLAEVAGGEVASVATSEIKIWEPTGSEGTNLSTVSAEIERHYYPVRALDVSESGRVLVSGSDDSTIAIWDVRTGRRTMNFLAHEYGVASVSICEKGGVIATGGRNGQFDKEVRVWSLVDGSLLHEESLNASRAWSTAITADGRYLVVGALFELHIWQLDDWTKRHELRFSDDGCYERDRTDPFGLCVVSDRVVTVGFGSSGILQTWDIETGEKLLEWKGHNDSVSRVVSSEGGRVIVSASFDQSVKLWNAVSGTLEATIAEFEAPVLGLAATQDGRLLVTACDDGTAQVWDLKRRVELASFTVDHPIWSCAISDCGEVFLGDSSGRVHFLRLESQTEL